MLIIVILFSIFLICDLIGFLNVIKELKKIEKRLNYLENNT